MPHRAADSRTQDAALAALANPARLVRRARRRIVRILDGWPTEDDILAAYRRIPLIT